MFGIRGIEFVIILVVILLVFGPSKIPALAKSIGSAISQFKSGLKSAKGDLGEIPQELNDTMSDVKEI